MKATTSVTREGESPTAWTASARRCEGVLNQKGEVPYVERAELTGRRLTADHRTCGWRGMARGERGRIRIRPAIGGLNLRCRLRAFDHDGVGHVDVDRIGVVVGRRLGSWRRLGVRLRGVFYVIVMMVMTAGTVVLAVSVVATNGEQVCVDVRSQVVSGGLAQAVRVAVRAAD